MTRNPTRSLTPIRMLALTALVAIPMLTGAGDLQANEFAYTSLMRAVGQTVASNAAEVFGPDSPQHCIITETLSLCIHPDTPPERVEELLRRLPTWEGDRYQLQQRWTLTATDGDVSGRDPINLTYSFLPDGVYIPGGAGEAGSNNRLYQELNSHFGSPSVWKPMFEEMFNDWGKHIGATYTEVSDDGAVFPGSPGVLGSRGDVRIGAHNIDGGWGILAYNYFPNVSDMVLDTSENWGAPSNDYRFFRNTCRHEHGHGLGLLHVNPENCQKLMEANLCTNFDGPQDDDIRGAMRYYGDTLEYNNSASAPTDLGVLEGRFSTEWPVSLTTSVDFDYFMFTTTGAAEVDVTIDPVGFTYNLEGVTVHTDAIMDLAFRILGGVNGTDILVQVDETSAGENETIVDFVVPTAGDYWVYVYRAAGSPDVQRFDLTIDVEHDSGLAVENGQSPRAGLDLNLYPNPFNPRTTARFYTDAAGPVALDVYDVAGKLVYSVRDQADKAGWHELSWDGRYQTGGSVPSGTYLLQVRAGGRIENVRGMLVE